MDNKKILIIEDKPARRKSIACNLKKDGYNISITDLIKTFFC